MENVSVYWSHGILYENLRLFESSLASSLSTQHCDNYGRNMYNYDIDCSNEYYGLKTNLFGRKCNIDFGSLNAKKIP
jgi:hypothetical protein